MKTFLLRVVVVLLPVLICIGAVNFLVDPGNLYGRHDYEQEIATLLVETKQNVTNVDNNPSYGIFKKNLCNLYRDSIDVLIIGNSQSLEISSKHIPNKKVLNLSIAGGLLDEACCMAYECYRSNLHPKIVLLGIDPFYFNENAISSQIHGLKETYRMYENCIDYNNQVVVYADFKKLFNIFSLSYFRQSFIKLRRSKNSTPKTTYNDENQTKTWRYDGSMVYEISMRHRTSSDAIEDAQTLFHTFWMGYNEVSARRVNNLIKLIKYIQSKESDVIVFMAPYHPVLWERFMSQSCFAQINESKKIVEDLLEKNNIEIIGNWNPNTCGFDYLDFYDATHARTSSLNKILGPRFSIN